MSHKLAKAFGSMQEPDRVMETTRKAHRIGQSFLRYYRPIVEWQANEELVDIEPPIRLTCVGLTELGYLLIAPDTDKGAFPNLGFLSFENEAKLADHIAWKESNGHTTME